MPSKTLYLVHLDTCELREVSLRPHMGVDDILKMCGLRGYEVLNFPKGFRLNHGYRPFRYFSDGDFIFVANRISTRTRNESIEKIGVPSPIKMKRGLGANPPYPLFKSTTESKKKGERR
jgi:hypothetical protein